MFEMRCRPRWNIFGVPLARDGFKVVGRAFCVLRLGNFFQLSGVETIGNPLARVVALLTGTGKPYVWNTPSASVLRLAAKR